MNDKENGIRAKKILSHVTPIDIFTAGNIGMFLFMCDAAYFDRFVKYRGYQYIWEFMIYAVFIIVFILFAWKTDPSFQYPRMASGHDPGRDIHAFCRRFCLLAGEAFV